MTKKKKREIEVENFTKTIKFDSGQFAIVDAEIVKSLKDKFPLNKIAIFVPTKQSREDQHPFTVTAIYNDATLQELKITPASELDNHDEHVSEGVQILGHEDDPVKKKLSKISRIASDTKPKSGHRKNRNKRYSKSGDPLVNVNPNKLTYKMAQKLGIDGAKRKDYGQKKVKESTEFDNKDEAIMSECIAILNKVKENDASSDYLDSLHNTYKIRSILADIRDNCYVTGESFDLVYNTVRRLDEYHSEKSKEWISNVRRIIDG